MISRVQHLHAIPIESDAASGFAFPFKFVSSSFPHIVGRRAFEKKSEFAMNPISEFAQDVA